MLTQTGDNMKLDTEEILITEKARSYNLGYTHGLEDFKMRALMDLWQSARPYQLAEPELYQLFKQAIQRIENLR
jgi:hypothetical protein